jgi:REP element-mobilizing transposase RayT
MKLSIDAKKRKNKQERTLVNSRAAGRPKIQKLEYVRHDPRPKIQKGHPVHITLKRSRSYETLRNSDFIKMIKLAVINARRNGLRIVYFTLQFDHIHLYIEAQDIKVLKSGMKAFTASIVYLLKTKNKLRRGIRFFKDRYHLVIKKTPIEVKRCITYILFNTAKHTGILTDDEDYTFAYNRPNKMAITLDPPQFWLSLFSHCR